MEQAEKKDLCVLADMMEQAKRRMEFLISFSTLTHSEMRLNSETFQWLQRIPSVLQEHRELITKSRREAEDALKVGGGQHTYMIYNGSKKPNHVLALCRHAHVVVCVSSDCNHMLGIYSCLLIYGSLIPHYNTYFYRST